MAKILCARCGEKYNSSLRKCPNCHNKTPIQVWQIVLLIFAFVFLFSCIFISVNMWDNNETSYSEFENKGNESVTYENYNKITNGMTYEQVVDIFGTEGEVLSDVDIGEDEFKTVVYCWYDSSEISNCNITFQGEKVVAKAQFGLK